MFRIISNSFWDDLSKFILPSSIGIRPSMATGIDNMAFGACLPFLCNSFTQFHHFSSVHTFFKRDCWRFLKLFKAHLKESSPKSFQKLSFWSWDLLRTCIPKPFKIHKKGCWKVGMWSRTFWWVFFLLWLLGKAGILAKWHPFKRTPERPENQHIDWHIHKAKPYTCIPTCALSYTITTIHSIDDCKSVLHWHCHCLGLYFCVFPWKSWKRTTEIDPWTITRLSNQIRQLHGLILIVTKQHICEETSETASVRVRHRIWVARTKKTKVVHCHGLLLTVNLCVT